MSPNEESMRRRGGEEDKREANPGMPPSVVRRQPPKDAAGGGNAAGLRSMSDLSGVSPEVVMRGMRYNMLPVLNPALGNDRNRNVPYFSPSPEGGNGTGAMAYGQQPAAGGRQLSTGPSVMGFLTQGQSWEDMGRNAGDVAVSLAKIPVKTADLLINGLDLFTDGNKVSGFLRDGNPYFSYRPGEALEMIESLRSDEGKAMKKGYDRKAMMNQRGFWGKGNTFGIIRNMLSMFLQIWRRNCLSVPR